MKETEYYVWNDTDNISTHWDTFKSIKEAEKFIKEFRERFKQQGYYRDNQWNKIAPKDIKLTIKKVD